VATTTGNLLLHGRDEPLQQLRPLTVALIGLGDRGRVRRLNLETADEPMHDPEQFRRDRAGEPAELGELNLGPYETVRIDTSDM
jgi:hypothetical protein